MVPPVAIDRLLERVRMLSHRGETGAVIEILRRLHPADSSEILYRIEPDAQHAIMQELPWEEVADVLEELDEEEMVEVVQGLSVVAQFAGTIAAVAILAALMPVVAAQGGNAGNQSMTIIVRSLALGQIDLGNFWAVIRHELGVGILHGIALGALVAAVTFVWIGNPVLSAVIGTAMLGNFLVAAIVGVLVPMTLRRFGVDPAFGSSMLVTASTDILGFSIFLGLASYLVAWLV